MADSYSYRNIGVDPLLCGNHRTEPHCSPFDNCDSTCGNEYLAQCPELRCREIACLDDQLSVVAFHHKKNTVWLGIRGTPSGCLVEPYSIAISSLVNSSSVQKASEFKTCTFSISILADSGDTLELPWLQKVATMFQ